MNCDKGAAQQEEHSKRTIATGCMQQLVQGARHGPGYLIECGFVFFIKSSSAEHTHEKQRERERETLGMHAQIVGGGTSPLPILGCEARKAPHSF